MMTVQARYLFVQEIKLFGYLFYFLLDHLHTHLRKLDVLLYIYEGGIRCVPLILQPLLQNVLDCKSVLVYLLTCACLERENLSLSLSLSLSLHYSYK